MKIGTQPASVHAVVLSGGHGSRMPPLASPHHPKALLTVSNRPMLFYSLFSLYRSSINNVTVIVDSDAHSHVSDYVKNVFPNDPALAILKRTPLTLHVISRSSNADTADALRSLHISQNDTLILSSDTIANAALDSFLDFHRSSAAACTVALSKVLPSSKSSKSSKSSSSSSSTPPFTPQLYTLLTESDRLLAMLHPTDLESSKATIPNILIERYQRLAFRSDLCDSHIYCFHTASLRHVLQHCPAISSVKYDLIPYVARRQHTLWRVADRASWPLPTDDFCVCAHVLPPSTYTIRTNTIPTFRTANLDVASGKLAAWLYPPNDPKLVEEPQKKEKKGRAEIPFSISGERVSVSLDTIVGNNCSAGDRTSVKKSVIGNGCTLGSNVKLNGCVLLANVEVMDGANLTSSVICEGAIIMASCILKECRVAAGTSVDEGTEAADRSFGSQVEDQAVGFSEGLGSEVDFF